MIASWFCFLQNLQLNIASLENAEKTLQIRLVSSKIRNLFLAKCHLLFLAINLKIYLNQYSFKQKIIENIFIKFNSGKYM